MTIISINKNKKNSTFRLEIKHHEKDSLDE